MANNPTLATMQELTQKYEYYRSGRGPHWRSNNAAKVAAKNAAIAATTIPRVAGGNPANLNHRFNHGRVKKNIADYYRGGAPNVLRKQLAPLKNVQTSLVLTNLASDGWMAGLRYKRPLGYGGQGVVALFEMQNIAGNMVECAVKTTLPQPTPAQDAMVLTALRDEDAYLTDLLRAPHIVRKLNFTRLYQNPGGIPPLAPPPVLAPPVVPIPPGGGVPTPAQTRFDNTLAPGPVNGLPVVIMENMTNGSLKYWLARSRYDNNPFPDEALWRILKCLVEACIAMKYPPREQRLYQPALVGGHRPVLPENGPPIPETIPPARKRYERNIIHFDLDPSNVFVGDFDATTHANMPIVKLADFGLAAEPPYDPNNLDYFWDARTWGKWRFYMPEQWTVEWDLYSLDPLAPAAFPAFIPGIAPPSKIAGRYSEKSNIWQIGLVLWCCITRRPGREPPWAQRVLFQYLPPPPGPPVVQPPPNFPIYRLVDGYSCGFELQNKTYLRHHDDLKRTIMHCLMYKPEERPNLAELLAICDYNISQGFSPAAQSQAWANAFFAAPPATRANPANYTYQHLNPINLNNQRRFMPGA